MKYYSLIKQKYMDKNCHVVQKDGDGGDSTHNSGAAWACVAAMNGGKLTADERTASAKVDYLVATTVNERGTGRYCRNPAPGRWYSNYNNQTRDAMINLEALWAIIGDVSTARRHYAQRIKRALFHFSHENDGYDSGLPLIRKTPDAPTPVELGLIIRSGRFWLLRPLLYILDLALWLDCAFVRKLNERNLYDYDAKLLPAMLAAQAVYPTFIVELARRAYAKTDAPARLRDYYSEAPGRNGIEPLGELMVETFQAKIVGEQT